MSTKILMNTTYCANNQWIYAEGVYWNVYSSDYYGDKAGICMSEIEGSCPSGVRKIIRYGTTMFNSIHSVNLIDIPGPGWAEFIVTTIDPCEDVVCNNVCIDYDLYSQKCVDGECVPDQLIEKNSSNCGYIPPDPCEGIICPDYCDDINHIKYTNGYCVNGKCVYDTIEENSVECGYIIPEIEEPIDKEPFDITKIYSLLAGIGLGAILLFKK